MFDRLSVWVARHLISTSGDRAYGCYALCLKMQKHCWRHTALLSLFQNRLSTSRALLSRFILFHRPKWVRFKMPIITFRLWFGDVLQKGNHRIDVYSPDTANHCVLQEKTLPSHVVDMKSLFWQRCATAFFVPVQNVKFDLFWKDVIWASWDVAIHCVLHERMCVFAFSFPEISRGYFATHCFVGHQRRLSNHRDSLKFTEF